MTNDQRFLVEIWGKRSMWLTDRLVHESTHATYAGALDNAEQSVQALNHKQHLGMRYHYVITDLQPERPVFVEHDFSGDTNPSPKEVQTTNPQWLVIAGNPVDGLSYHGPFDDFDDAQAWAEEEAPDAEYWVTQLQPARIQGPTLVVDNGANL